ncbi:LOW QUALITY PROTEIN: hypothetical protein ACHAXT_013215 [Thalassiosira profunda]
MPGGRRLLVILLALAAVAFTSIFRLMGALSIDGSDLTERRMGIEPMPLPQRRPKLADGCYHVFLDLGANLGVHTRFLFEPSLYPKAWIARKFFTAHFGPEANRDFCAFAFEPNPAHIPRHEAMRAAYSAMGWRHHFISAGVGDRDGNMTFYRVADDLGYTAMPKKGCLENNCPRQQVPVIRLSHWIDREVHGRRIPTRAYGGRGYVAGPRVVVKMDIENLEWLVFPDLVSTGVLCRNIDAVISEFHCTHLHWHMYPISFPERNLTLRNYTEAEALRDGILKEITTRNCKTRIEMRDDESHADDGMPWPKPPI